MLMHVSLLSSLLLAVLFRSNVASAAPLLPDGFAFWIWQSSLVFENWLYIDGGEIWARWNASIPSASHVWNQQTLAIDLSTSWNTSSVSAVASNKTSNVPIARRPDMWYDPTADMVYSTGGDFYVFEGDPYNLNVTPGLWGFQPQNDGSVTWQAQSSNVTSNVAGALTATSSKEHIRLGGYMVFNQPGSPSNDGYIAMEEMLSFNFANESLYNESFSSNRLFGEAQYVPIYGKEGVVLFLGGESPSSRNIQTQMPLQGLDTILVYDIHTGSFFQQAASNAPSSRYAFCSVAAGGTQNGSYEIFIYGGSQGSESDTDDLSKVYILTLPAFHWIEIPEPGPIWRADHHCSLIGNRHMLSIGGIQDNASTSAWASSTDPWANGLGIFDMTALNWTDTYDASAAPYEPGVLITKFYSNNSKISFGMGGPCIGKSLWCEFTFKYHFNTYCHPNLKPIR